MIHEARLTVHLALFDSVYAAAPLVFRDDDPPVFRLYLSLLVCQRRVGCGNLR
jgi:hypothetical protein